MFIWKQLVQLFCQKRRQSSAPSPHFYIYRSYLNFWRDLGFVTLFYFFSAQKLGIQQAHTA